MKMRKVAVNLILFYSIMIVADSFLPMKMRKVVVNNLLCSPMIFYSLDAFAPFLLLY